LVDYTKYWRELLAAFFSVIIAGAFYLISNEVALSIALAIILAAFSIQAALIKANVQEALESNLELYNTLTSIKNPFFKIRANRVIDNCLKELKSLASETYEVYGPEPAFLEIMQFYEKAKPNDLIQSAVIYEEDIILDGIYFEHHRDAIKRGVNIIKIFIFNEGMPISANPERHFLKIKAFEDVGVQTYLVRQKTIGPDSRLMADFLIYENIIGISIPGRNGMLSSIRITSQKDVFEDYKHRFEELLKIADPVKDIETYDGVKIKIKKT
jgi:hypothetical protein